MQISDNTELSEQKLVPFNSFLKQNGRSASWGWRLRQKGWIATVNIDGRLYVAQAEIDRFHQRAAAGEFARQSRSGFIYDDPLAEMLKSRAVPEIAGNTETVSAAGDQKTAVTQAKLAAIG